MTEHPETPAAPKPRSRAHRIVRTTRHVPMAVVWTTGIVVVLTILVFTLSFADEPLRRSMERKINERLTGYDVRVPKAHFNLFGLGVTLNDVQIAQQSNPTPPVAFIPKLKARLLWSGLLSFHLVSDFEIKEPQVHVNLSQLRKEAGDSVKLKDRGWQAAALAIFPLKIDRLNITDANVDYVDEDPTRPLIFTKVKFTAGNIRNIHSKDREYPSPIHAEGVVFNQGRATLDGHADFLAQPSVTLDFDYILTNIPLDELKPIADRKSLTLKGGTLASTGSIEYGEHVKILNIHNVDVAGIKLDYHHMVSKALGNVNKAVANVAGKENYILRVDTVNITGSEFGMLRQTGKHPYRLYFTNADFNLTNYSNRFEEGDARATLHAKFMGAGRTAARVLFRPETTGPDFDLDVAIEDTPLTSMNDMLRSYGKLDVTKGTLAFYSQLSVSNHRMSGYVKPLIKDIKVYDWKQDKHNNVFNQLYEIIASGFFKVVKNQHTDEVATRATLSGPVGTTTASTWELIGNAFENAFIKEITPGFDKILGKKPKK